MDVAEKMLCWHQPDVRNRFLQAGSAGTHTKINRTNRHCGSNHHMHPIYSSFIFRYSWKHNIAHQTVVGACARTGVRKISTDARLTEGGLEGGENWCTTERGVHYSRGEGTCGALRGVEAMAWAQPVELCTTEDYNYSVYCTFTNLQLQIILHYYGQLMCAWTTICDGQRHKLAVLGQTTTPLVSHRCQSRRGVFVQHRQPSCSPSWPHTPKTEGAGGGGWIHTDFSHLKSSAAGPSPLWSSSEKYFLRWIGKSGEGLSIRSLWVRPVDFFRTESDLLTLASSGLHPWVIIACIIAQIAQYFVSVRT